MSTTPIRPVWWRRSVCFRISDWWKLPISMPYDWRTILIVRVGMNSAIRWVCMWWMRPIAKHMVCEARWRLRQIGVTLSSIGLSEWLSATRIIRPLFSGVWATRVAMVLTRQRCLLGFMNSTPRVLCTTREHRVIIQVKERKFPTHRQLMSSRVSILASWRNTWILASLRVVIRNAQRMPVGSDCWKSPTERAITVCG